LSWIEESDSVILEHVRLNLIISGCCEVIFTFVRAEEWDGGPEGITKRADGSFRLTVQDCFQLAKSHLHRVEVGAVGRDVLPINWSIRNWNFPLMIP